MVSVFHIFPYGKIVSLFFKIISSQREFSLSLLFLTSCIFSYSIPISHLGCSFFQLLFLFFQCYLHFTPPSPLNGAHGWRDHVHCKRRGSICSGTPEDSKDAGTNRSQVRGSNHSIREAALAHPAVGWALSVLFHSHGATTLLWGLDWWRPVYRVSNTANQQHGGARALKPGCQCQERIIPDEAQQQWQEQWDVKMGKMQTKNWLGKSVF